MDATNMEIPGNEGKNQKYVCVNCGAQVKSIYKVNSPNEIELVQCPTCYGIVDNYFVYHYVTAFIDLLMLRQNAFKHFVYNTNFSSHWVLAFLIHVIEVYTEWVCLADGPRQIHPFYYEFLRICIKVTHKNLRFIITWMSLTFIYSKFLAKRLKIRPTVLQTWKCLILTNFGVFFYVPCLMFNKRSIRQWTTLVVKYYNFIAEVLLYEDVFNCSKWWSMFVMLACLINKEFFRYKYIYDYHVYGTELTYDDDLY